MIGVALEVPTQGIYAMNVRWIYSALSQVPIQQSMVIKTHFEMLHDLLQGSDNPSSS